MTGNPGEPSDKALSCHLHGWDDEKVYFHSPETGERCVSDEPELLRRLTETCADYFLKHPAGGKAVG
jgi:hypothetical protein